MPVLPRICPERRLHVNRSTVILVLLATLFLSAVPLSLLIGIYPVSAINVGRILLHLALPWADPHSPPWTQSELIVVAVVLSPSL